ncbi:hypothetical protein AHiyo1_05650 [Arthrobacter sp. Hiyo1]|nr:hypothetical protein AHiyo1_05650 [Arthrobacter sp. Hiyo1]
MTSGESARNPSTASLTRIAAASMAARRPGTKRSRSPVRGHSGPRADRRGRPPPPFRLSKGSPWAARLRSGTGDEWQRPLPGRSRLLPHRQGRPARQGKVTSPQCLPGNHSTRRSMRTGRTLHGYSNVGESPLFGLTVVLDFRFEVLFGVQPALLVRLVQIPLREVRPVATQGPWQGSGTAAPPGVPVAREGPGVEAGDKDNVPFQAFGRVDCQQLHCLVVHLCVGHVQSTFF